MASPNPFAAENLEAIAAEAAFAFARFKLLEERRKFGHESARLPLPDDLQRHSPPTSNGKRRQASRAFAGHSLLVSQILTLCGAVYFEVLPGCPDALPAKIELGVDRFARLVERKVKKGERKGA